MNKDVLIYKEINRLRNVKRRSPFLLKIPKLFFGITSRIAPGLTTKFLLTQFYKPDHHRLNNGNKARQIKPLTSQKEELFLKNGQHKLHVSLHGNGPRVLLCHGWGGSSSSFHCFIDPLVNSGFQAVTVDFPAHGLSSGKESSMFDFIKTIELINDKLGSINAIIGHSVSGLATINFLADSSNVEKAILISSPASIKTVVGTYKRLLNLSDKVTHRIEDNLEKKFNITIHEKSINALNTKLNTPVLIFHDKFDYTIPYSDGICIAQKWPNAKFISTIGLGHHRILKDETVIVESINFLKNN